MRYSAEYGRQTIGIVDIWAQDVGAALMRTFLAGASLLAVAVLRVVLMTRGASLCMFFFFFPRSAVNGVPLTSLLCLKRVSFPVTSVIFSFLSGRLLLYPHVCADFCRPDLGSIDADRIEKSYGIIY